MPLISYSRLSYSYHSQFPEKWYPIIDQNSPIAIPGCMCRKGHFVNATYQHLSKLTMVNTVPSSDIPICILWLIIDQFFFQYTCMTASKKYIAMGSNTGGLYIFDRQTLKHPRFISNKVQICCGRILSLLGLYYRYFSL